MRINSAIQADKHPTQDIAHLRLGWEMGYHATELDQRDIMTFDEALPVLQTQSLAVFSDAKFALKLFSSKPFAIGIQAAREHYLVQKEAVR